MPRRCSARGGKLSRRETRDLDVKIGFIEGLVQRDPAYMEALQLLGDHYSERGRFSQSLKVDQRLAELDPKNPLVFYNLACSHSLNGELALAAAALHQALLLGYRDFGWLAKDPDLRRLRNHTLYAKILKVIEQMKGSAT